MTKKQLNAISRSYANIKVENQFVLESFVKNLNKIDLSKTDNWDLYNKLNEMYLFFQNRIDNKIMYAKDIKKLFEIFKYHIKVLNFTCFVNDLVYKCCNLTNCIYDLCSKRTYYSKVYSINDLIESEVK